MAAGQRPARHAARLGAGDMALAPQHESSTHFDVAADLHLLALARLIGQVEQQPQQRAILCRKGTCKMYSVTIEINTHFEGARPLPLHPSGRHS